MPKKNKYNKRGLFVFYLKLQHDDKEIADGKQGILIKRGSNSGRLIE